jgi:hypothetical protein
MIEEKKKLYHSAPKTQCNKLFLKAAAIFLVPPHIANLKFQ